MDKLINQVMIELSANIEEADSYIESLGYKTISEKNAYLQDMFDVQLIGRNDEDDTQKSESEEMDYYALLNVIINRKWGA